MQKRFAEQVQARPPTTNKITKHVSKYGHLIQNRKKWRLSCQSRVEYNSRLGMDVL
ncbi:hypothetical protein BC829DRAFT_195192 [Chytridium lagenaria]|nr:hypothetical protein BC829DRAFT_195192 [Chytridium lagenaria]